MKFCDYNINELKSEGKKGKKIICFGAGFALKRFISKLELVDAKKYISDIVDNDKGKWNRIEYGVKISPLKKIIEEKNGPIIIVITCLYLNEIYEQLSNIPALEDSEVAFYGFVLDRMKEDVDNAWIDIPHDTDAQIPKIIHYCWFGRKKIPFKNREWMKSWKKYCPDYEIVEWNENNYDIKKNTYMAEAYEAKRWGFVPDYARLDIIHRYGGIYVDVDVEFVKSFDELLFQKGFMGFVGTDVALGLGFGAVVHNKWIKELRDVYNNKHFINENGLMNLSSCESYQNPWLQGQGVRLDGTFQRFSDVNVYPEWFFSSKSQYNGKLNIGKQTFSIHHYDGSWLTDKQQIEFHSYSDFYKDIVTHCKKHCSSQEKL